jgi:hypothetical protein
MSLEIYTLITGGLENESSSSFAFPEVDFENCVKSGAMSLKKLQLVPSIAQLKRVFADASLQAQFGFSQVLSFVLVLFIVVMLCS